MSHAGAHSVPVLRELIPVMFWLATQYAPSAAARPDPGRAFDVTRIPRAQPCAVHGRTAGMPLAGIPIDDDDVERAFQQRLIRRVADVFEQLAFLDLQVGDLSIVLGRVRQTVEVA